MKAKYFSLGSVLVVLFALFAVTGCSDNYSVSTTNVDSDEIALSPIDGELGDRDSSQFMLSGRVVDVDDVKSLVVLAAKTDSDRNESETKYSMEVSKNATVILLRDRSEVAFDSKYVEIGTNVVVYGTTLRDGTMLAERFELWQDDPTISSGSFE
jgi:hypothetical protein